MGQNSWLSQKLQTPFIIVKVFLQRLFCVIVTVWVVDTCTYSQLRGCVRIIVGVFISVLNFIKDKTIFFILNRIESFFKYLKSFRCTTSNVRFLYTRFPHNMTGIVRSSPFLLPCTYKNCVLYYLQSFIELCAEDLKEL